MSQENGRPAKCTNPIEATVLADYWLAALPEAEEETIEEHLFTCDECGARLREVVALAEALRNLTREGSLQIVVSDKFLRRAAEEDLRVRQYAPPRGGSVQCTVTAEDNILIGRLAADLKGAERVDLSICDERGVEQSRMRDIPVNPSEGSVIVQESITFAKAAPTSKMILRLLNVDEAGDEKLLGEYTFNHTRSLPGPGAW
jgi:anti-sigma factor RsiW